MINQLIPQKLFEFYNKTRKVYTTKTCLSIMKIIYDNIVLPIWSLHANALAQLGKELRISKNRSGNALPLPTVIPLHTSMKTLTTTYLTRICRTYRVQPHKWLTV